MIRIKRAQPSNVVIVNPKKEYRDQRTSKIHTRNADHSS